MPCSLSALTSTGLARGLRYATIRTWRCKRSSSWKSIGWAKRRRDPKATTSSKPLALFISYAGQSISFPCCNQSTRVIGRFTRRWRIIIATTRSSTQSMAIAAAARRQLQQASKGNESERGTTDLLNSDPVLERMVHRLDPISSASIPLTTMPVVPNIGALRTLAGLARLVMNIATAA